ncbi:MAG: RloB family protein [Chloroflexi bacterium]|nr:RloB family protein [Chloroflexota bacterium]
MSKGKRGSSPGERPGGWGSPRDQPGRRGRGSRIRRPLVLVVVEGAQTEKQYFESLAKEARASAVHVEVVPNKGDTAPENLIRQAEKARKSKMENDKWEDDGQVWCVCDTEQPDLSASFRNALAVAKKRGIQMAVSNPAFEYWYLLHFRDSTSPCTNGQEMKKKLRRFIKDYHEAMDVYPLLRLQTDTAIARASHLRAQSDGDWERYVNPSTGVDQLVCIVLNRSQG